MPSLDPWTCARGATTAALLSTLAAALTGCGGSTPAPARATPPADGAGGGTPGGSAATPPGGTAADPSKPPIAARRPHAVTSPFGTREDPYYWLRDDTRKDADVLAYLNAESEYTRRALAPLASLEEKLFAEFRARVKEDDSSVPTLDDGYWYYTRFETGKQHPIYARRKGAMTAPEEILLDGNQLATGHAFHRIGDYAVSRDGKLLAWTEDTVGRNQFTLRVKNLATGEQLADTAANIAPSIVWANDNKTLFYVGKDPTTLRTDRVLRHALGGAPEQIYKEDDGQYFVFVGATKSKRYIAIAASATTNSEFRLVDADKPASAPRVFIPRSKDHIYLLDHLDGRFVVRTNSDAKNFRLVEIAPGQEQNRRAWKELIPHDPQVLVDSFALYHGFTAVTVRTGGLSKVRVLPRRGGAYTGGAYTIDAPEAASTMSVLDTPDADAKRVRFAYTAMTVPASVYELDVATKERKLLKQTPVPTYDATQYASEYVHATAADGTKIPISIVYKKSTARDGRAPVLVYGYGSYGISQDPRFNSQMVSLLDRGWVYAMAHIRGGQELGRGWYEDGKLQQKKNTFTDFIAATEHLVAQRYGDPKRVFAMGGSAGGLLMGAIVNMRPELYRGIVALVPFVDVVTTMLDTSIPLTTNEFDEWGNPGADKAAYDYMLSYSPYDNVRATGYPAMYVQTGLWDSQVQYFEPAKWVARLRATKTDDNLLVLDIDMTSGHGGAAGRFDRMKQLARSMAFLVSESERPDRRAR